MKLLFPGGKIEWGEAPEEALRRELREELAADVAVGPLIRSICCDYPDFSLTLHCYWCTLNAGSGLQLREHEAARWVGADELESLDWLPADRALLPSLLPGLR